MMALDAVSPPPGAAAGSSKQELTVPVTAADSPREDSHTPPVLSPPSSPHAHSGRHWGEHEDEDRVPSVPLSPKSHQNALSSVKLSPQDLEFSQQSVTVAPSPLHTSIYAPRHPEEMVVPYGEAPQFALASSQPDFGHDDENYDDAHKSPVKSNKGKPPAKSKKQVEVVICKGPDTILPKSRASGERKYVCNGHVIHRVTFWRHRKHGCPPCTGTKPADAEGALYEEAADVHSAGEPETTIRSRHTGYSRRSSIPGMKPEREPLTVEHAYTNPAHMMPIFPNPYLQFSSAMGGGPVYGSESGMTLPSMSNFRGPTAPSRGPNLVPLGNGIYQDISHRFDWNPSSMLAPDLSAAGFPPQHLTSSILQMMAGSGSHGGMAPFPGMHHGDYNHSAFTAPRGSSPQVSTNESDRSHSASAEEVCSKDFSS